MHLTPKQVALAYIDACSRKDFDAVAPLLSGDLSFVGRGNATHGSEPYLMILRRLGAVWERSDVKHTFSDGDDVCVIYDFVTNTEAGAVPSRVAHDSRSAHPTRRAVLRSPELPASSGAAQTASHRRVTGSPKTSAVPHDPCKRRERLGRHGTHAACPLGAPRSDAHSVAQGSEDA